MEKKFISKPILVGFRLLDEFNFYPDWPDNFNELDVFATSEDAEKYRAEHLDTEGWRIEAVWVKSNKQKKKFRIHRFSNV